MIDDHVCLAFAGASSLLLFSSLPRTERRRYELEPSRDGSWADHLHARFLCLSLGLTADGRIIIDKARVECQSHRLTVEDPVSVEYITRYIAAYKQVRLLWPPPYLAGVPAGLTFVLSNLYAAVHAIGWRAAVWHLVLAHWIRPERQRAAALPDRTLGHLLCLEGACAPRRSTPAQAAHWSKTTDADLCFLRRTRLVGRPRRFASSLKRTTGTT